jgi:hypothetical protein
VSQIHKIVIESMIFFFGEFLPKFQMKNMISTNEFFVKLMVQISSFPNHQIFTIGFSR